MDLPRLVELLNENWGYIALLLPLLVGGIGLLAQGKLAGVAHQTVAAVYRVSIHAATELQRDGIEWLNSQDGISFRKDLAERAYDALPPRIGPVPVGLLKVFITRERWIGWVEAAFQDVVAMACRLEFPTQLDAAGGE